MSEKTGTSRVGKKMSFVQPDLSTKGGPVTNKKTLTISGGQGRKNSQIVGPDLSGGGWVKRGK